MPAASAATNFTNGKFFKEFAVRKGITKNKKNLSNANAFIKNNFLQTEQN
jgi:hypothetical protein